MERVGFFREQYRGKRKIFHGGGAGVKGVLPIKEKPGESALAITEGQTISAGTAGRKNGLLTVKGKIRSLPR